MNNNRCLKKWKPFNNVISGSTILNDLIKEKRELPTLFPEEQLKLINQIKDAFYSKEKVTIAFYEENQIKELTTFISKLTPYLNTIELGGVKTITFNQVYYLKVR